jgi:hypothetical protein
MKQSKLVYCRAERPPHLQAVKLGTVTVCVNNIQHNTELTVSSFSTATNRTNFDLANTGDLEFRNNKFER